MPIFLNEKTENKVANQKNPASKYLKEIKEKKEKSVVPQILSVAREGVGAGIKHS